MAIDLLNEIEEIMRVKLNMKDLVEAPSIAELSIVVSEYKNSNQQEALFDPNQTLFPLTLNQKQVWGINALNPKSVVHNISSGIRIKKPLEIKILNQTINLIIARHESLRTRFKVSGGVPKQEILPEFKMNLEIENIKEEELLGLINQEMKFVFKLDEAPLFRLKFYKLGTDDFVFFFLFHHIIWDGLSNNFFFHEFMAIYKALSEGSVIPAFESTMTYKEHALLEGQYLKSEEFLIQKEKWKNYLSGDLPVLNLPTDYPRPARINNESETVYFEVKKDLLHRLESYAQSKNISLYNMCFTVYNIMMARLSGGNELVIGTPVHGRHHRESRKTLGFFINTLPVRTKLEPDKSFRQNLALFMKSLKQSFYIQNIPLDIILQIANTEIDQGRTPLFQTLYVYLDVTKELDVLKEEKIEQLKADRFSVHTELDFYCYKSRDKIDGVIEYRKDLYSRKTMENMAELFQELLLKVIENDQITLSELGLKEEIQNQKFAPLNDRAYEKFDNKNSFLWEYEKFVMTSPESLALKTKNISLTYKELDNKVNSLALKLIESGVHPNSLVGICTGRNENMLIAMLAVIKTGAGYVPLDPTFPDERLLYMIERSDLSLLLLEEKFEGRFNHPKKIVIQHILHHEHKNMSFVPREVGLSQTCYVLFTSGSTGKPKGVEVSHLNVLNFLLSMKKKPGFGKNDKMLSVTTFSFDISVLELFLPLISGGSVYIADENEIINGNSLSEIIEKENITCMQATPTTWRLMLASAWQGDNKLKVLCGGEAMPKDLAMKLISKVSEVWNMYGPTETTVWSTIKKLSLSDKKILVGNPIDNTVTYILDDELKLCPLGVAGNLYIGGLGVAKGYLGDEAQTKARFINNPFRADERIYNTGDLARYNEEGEIECLGRSDDQVKIRGYRIELGEIENALLLHNKLSECAVKVHDQRIVAYVVQDGHAFSENEIKDSLKKVIPLYMIPNKIIFMDVLPKTLNGKIDRLKLVEGINVEKVCKADEASPETAEIIAGIWKNVIGNNEILHDDNFFAVGGHSIAAVEIFGMINDRFQIDLPLSSLFDASTIKDFSKIVDGALEKKAQALSALKCVVAIKPVISPGEPVFCFHGVGGNVLNYYRLADHVGHRAFYGIQSLGVNGKDQIIECIHEMAKNYIEEIKKVQPRGPYILSGGSMGGMVALEAAIQLRKNGDDVKALIMFDTVGPDLDFNTYGEERINYLTRLKNSMLFRADKIINSMKVKFYLLTKASIPHSVRYFSIEDKNFVALRRYRPEIYEGNIVLIRAPRKASGYYADPFLGWRNTINGKIETIEIQGEHKSFIESPELSYALKSVLHKI